MEHRQQKIPEVKLKPGREKSLRRKHPWIFSGAIAEASANIKSGETVRIDSSDGKPLGLGAWSPNSQISLRLWTTNPRNSVNPEWFRKRLEKAIAMRRELPGIVNAEAKRLIYSEADRLPGLIVDQYGKFLVCQFLSAGAEFWKNEFIAILRKLLPEVTGILERSDTGIRAKEGLPPGENLLWWGEEPPPLLEIKENGLKFLIDLRQGHKTGFYLDQRFNRAMTIPYASGRSVLNVFSYTGGFGIAAAKGGAASILQLDDSASALELAAKNAEINNLDPEIFEYEQGDAFQILRSYRDRNRKFDMIILDPPKFAASSSQIDKAARGYKDINLLALKLLNHGGILLTFSCSGHISPELFQKIVASAADDAGRRVLILDFLSQAPDHPIALNFPESRYLKGLICRTV